MRVSSPRMTHCHLMRSRQSRFGLLSITENFTEAGIRFVSDGIRHQICRRDWPNLFGIALTAADAGLACASGNRVRIASSNRGFKIARDNSSPRDNTKRHLEGARNH